MHPDDPNFPAEIPPIPEPTSPEAEPRAEADGIAETAADMDPAQVTDAEGTMGSDAPSALEAEAVEAEAPPTDPPPRIESEAEADLTEAAAEDLTDEASPLTEAEAPISEASTVETSTLIEAEAEASSPIESGVADVEDLTTEAPTLIDPEDSSAEEPPLAELDAEDLIPDILTEGSAEESAPEDWPAEDWPLTDSEAESSPSEAPALTELSAEESTLEDSTPEELPLATSGAENALPTASEATEPELDDWTGVDTELPADAAVPAEAPPPPQRSRRNNPAVVVMTAGLRQWHRLLQTVRSRLPTPVRRLSDGVLTAMVLGTLVLGLVLLNPGRQQPVPIVLPAAPLPATPPPLPTIPPVTELQTQFDELSATYGNDLVQSVTVNIPNSQLTVTLDDAWYDLPNDQQDDLAQEILDQTRTLALNQLEVASALETLARSPAVGEMVVILHRHRPPSDLRIPT